MCYNDTPTHSLKLVYGSLVLPHGIGRAVRVELEQELARTATPQTRGPFLHAKLHELGVVDLEAHVEREVWCGSMQRVKRSKHAIVVEIGVATMRSADDAGDARLTGSRKHRKAVLQVRGTIVHPRKDVAVDVPHTYAPANRYCLRGKRVPRITPPHSECAGHSQLA